MTLQIEQLDQAQAEQNLPGLVALLQDAVASGASIGFFAPLSDAEANHYWRGVLAEVAQGSKILLAAFDGAALAGSVQLALATKPNAAHRAEVQKLCVHRSHRNQGIGRALMLKLEELALQLGRTLLVLDTKRGDLAETLYPKLGYTVAGIIPRYVREADGHMYDTVVFWRELGRE